MTDNELSKKVGQLGYQLFEIEKSLDVNNIISEVIKAKNMRLLEGFPVLLVNAIKKGNFDYNKVLDTLKNKNDKKLFLTFIFLSLSLYQHEHLKFWWANKLYNKFSQNEKEQFKTYLTYFNYKHNFKILDYKLNSERLLNIFKSYYKDKNIEFPKEETKHQDLSLEYALSQIFSPKQKSLFFKRLRGEKMSKTEKEYYSRAVKKRIISLANFELHRLAKQILEH